jgi:hypothetical protein
MIPVWTPWNPNLTACKRGDGVSTTWWSTKIGQGYFLKVSYVETFLKGVRYETHGTIRVPRES